MKKQYRKPTTSGVALEAVQLMAASPEGPSVPVQGDEPAAGSQFSDRQGWSSEGWKE